MLEMILYIKDEVQKSSFNKNELMELSEAVLYIMSYVILGMSILQTLYGDYDMSKLLLLMSILSKVSYAVLATINKD